MISYTDIGHNSEADILWIILDGELNTMRRGGNWTHELLWGEDIVKCWRGRYEIATGKCSIAPPESAIGKAYRPPMSVWNKLTSAFPVFRFYYFADVADEFSPNPRDRRDRE